MSRPISKQSSSSRLREEFRLVCLAVNSRLACLTSAVFHITHSKKRRKQKGVFKNTPRLRRVKTLDYTVQSHSALWHARLPHHHPRWGSWKFHQCWHKESLSTFFIISRHSSFTLTSWSQRSLKIHKCTQTWIQWLLLAAQHSRRCIVNAWSLTVLPKVQPACK